MGQCSTCGHEAAVNTDLRVGAVGKSPKFFLEEETADFGLAKSPTSKGEGDSPTRISTAASNSDCIADVSVSGASGAQPSTAPSAAGDADAERDLSPDGGRGGGERDEVVRALFSQLRVVEAAALLEEQQDGHAEGDGGGDRGLRGDLRLHLEQLSGALDVLARHPGMAALIEGAQTPPMPERLLGVPLSGGVRAAPARGSEAGNPKRDVLNVKVDLDGNGLVVDAYIEFFPDGTVSSEWVAADLPIPLPNVVCLCNEVDLLPEIAPYMVKAEVVHQFDTNEADRVLRIISKPPIPLVAGFEQTSTSMSFDLFDTPWRGLCLVQNSPRWEAIGKESQWRGCTQPKPYAPGYKQIDVKRVVALARPGGERGELTTIVFSAKGDLKIPRNMIPNWCISWLAQTIGRFVYQKALARISKFDETEHGERLRNHETAFYTDLHQRIAEFVSRSNPAEGST